MKNIVFIFLSFLILNCNSEGGPDCLKSQGDLETQEISVEEFSKINISKGIELVVKEDLEQTVKVTMGENLINDIQFEVIDGELKITNENGCEMLRNYHSAKVYITTPVLEKIYSASQYSIQSDGVLRFPELTLESGIIEDTPSSVFEMQIENERLIVNDNISSVFKISGSSDKLEINFWGSNGRFEGENYIVEDVYINHRSTNDIIVFPVQSVTGAIRSTGNLVLKNLPPIVEVEQLYTGHIVYP
ncbi:head GIN domain-containing protein [Moheibacter lacus]|uniref:DUF2807 domain-containing protein n=1 Tax=Moheibacter lacus TaxID=2745851 RepID=A0A838ZN39_9FLAO|nr:head GIN domain-containing protein [Moheibacter lacus]MBA5629056.1 DUF2807 domain-containing protein [Moheibacter lacus]